MTHSAQGECGITLPVHGGVMDREVDIFGRDGAFMERVLAGPVRLAATITL